MRFNARCQIDCRLSRCTFSSENGCVFGQKRRNPKTTKFRPKMKLAKTSQNLIFSDKNENENEIQSLSSFQWPWTTPTPGFNVTPLFDAEYLRNGTRYSHSFNGILIWTYTHLTQQCDFEWPWVTLSYLAKYSMTGSVVQSFCDSWAYCLFMASIFYCMYQSIYIWIQKHLARNLRYLSQFCACTEKANG